MSSSADRYLTVFSPEGKLWQVEYAFKAVKQSEVTAVGVKGKNCVAVVVQKKVPDRLIDPKTVTHMFRITENVGSCLVGYVPDVYYICRRLRYEAGIFERKNGFTIPVSVLASRLSEIHQLESQYAGLRPTAVSALLFGYDSSTNDFALFKVEPSGFFSGYRAVSCGVKEVEAMSALEKKMGAFESPDQAAEFAVSTLQTVVGVDFEAKEIELAVMTKDSMRFNLLNTESIDKILHAVAEKD